MTKPIMMTEEYWRNSQLSVAGFYGGCELNGNQYSIVNKEGITLRELSDPLGKHYAGDGMAIAPGEPADLVMDKWIPIYKKLGRERFMEVVSDPKITITAARKL